VSELTVRLIREPWADTGVALPACQTAGAAGADIRANFAEDRRDTGLTLAPMQRLLVPTGLRLEIPPGFEGQVRPRSGLALKHGVTLLNTPGTIDSDYRGPIGVMLINLGDAPYVVTHGDRIAQLIIAPVQRARFQAVASLNDTARGTAGFGSTGAR